MYKEPKKAEAVLVLESNDVDDEQSIENSIWIPVEERAAKSWRRRLMRWMARG